jgi:hypothetical protein
MLMFVNTKALIDVAGVPPADFETGAAPKP